MAHALHDRVTKRTDPSANRRETPRDKDYADRMAFVSACFDLAKSHPAFAVIAADDRPDMSVISSAVDAASPVLASIADSLDAQIEDLAAWNVRAAGKNEAIASAVQRNWLELQKLGWTDRCA